DVAGRRQNLAQLMRRRDHFVIGVGGDRWGVVFTTGHRESYSWASYSWASDRPPRLFEQRLLAHPLGLAAFAPFRAHVVRVDVAAPIRPEIGAGLDERARIGDDVEDALVERLGR